MHTNIWGNHNKKRKRKEMEKNKLAKRMRHRNIINLGDTRGTGTQHTQRRLQDTGHTRMGLEAPGVASDALRASSSFFRRSRVRRSSSTACSMWPSIWSFVRMRLPGWRAGEGGRRANPPPLQPQPPTLDLSRQSTGNVHLTHRGGGGVAGVTGVIPQLISNKRTAPQSEAQTLWQQWHRFAVTLSQIIKFNGRAQGA